MKITELIAKLEEVKKEHGDLPVFLKMLSQVVIGTPLKCLVASKHGTKSKKDGILLAVVFTQSQKE